MSKKGWEAGGKYKEDPIGSNESRGKNREQRKARGDGPNWTPTERHRKAELMRQFLAIDGPKGASLEYVNSEVWCLDCDGRRMKVDGQERCEKCQHEHNQYA